MSAKYHVMNEDQRKLANEAAETIDKAVAGMHPMAVFEALCTHSAMLAVALDLPVSSAIDRIEDRHNFFLKLAAGAKQGGDA